MQKLISIDLYADFGMLKKPDTNEPVYLTFNMLHKPALLGILGAIIGEAGFKEKGKLPDYYIKLKNLKVGIQPLKHENGNFQKTTIAYNNTTGMASQEQGGNLIVTEQTLVAPAFCCYFLLDLDIELHQRIDKNLSNYHAEYLPYLGKNEFSVWWKNYKKYDNVEEFTPNDSFIIDSVYLKSQPLKDGKTAPYFLPMFGESVQGSTFSYFERLPVGYDEQLFQYLYADFAFTDWQLKLEYKLEYPLFRLNKNEIIQLF